jgi:hypothetical protein
VQKVINSRKASSKALGVFTRKFVLKKELLRNIMATQTPE